MDRIQGPTVAPGNLFTDGDPNTATPATVVEDVWLNNVQEELANAILSQLFALDAGDQHQLEKALLRIAGGGSNFLINTEGAIQSRVFASLSAASGVATEIVGLDHWWSKAGGTGDVAEINGTAFGADTVIGFPSRPRGYLHFKKTTNNTSGANPTLRQSVEGVQPLSGLPVVLAFDGKKFSGSDLAIVGVDVEQNFGTAGSSPVTTALTSVAAGPTIDGTPRRFVFAGTLPDITGKTIGLQNHLKVRIKFATNQLFDVILSAFVLSRGAQDPGYIARGTAIELELCRRFCETNRPLSSSPELMDAALWDTALSLSAGDVLALKRRFLTDKFSGAVVVTWYAHDAAAGFITEGASTKHAVTSQGGLGIDTGYPRITSPPAGGTLRLFRAFWLATCEIPDSP